MGINLVVRRSSFEEGSPLLDIQQPCYDILMKEKNLARMPSARDGLSVVGTPRRSYSTEGVYQAQGDGNHFG